MVTLAADILIASGVADAIALVRRHLWVQQGTFMPSERERESIKVPRLLYHGMLDSLAYAA